MQFAAADGFTLHGTIYEGGPDAILIASALGVKRRYYDAFAQFAKQRGFTVLTFDYRGIGESRPSSLRKFKASMRDWGALDLPGAIDVLKDARSITLVGHSAGGQVVGLAKNAHRIDRMVFVAAQAGYYGNYPGIHKHTIRLIWNLMPLASRVLGFFPSKALRLGSEDLPRGVATQWAKWGRHPQYLFGFEDATRYAAMNVPLLAWSFEGDWYAPPLAVDKLVENYRGARVERRHVPDRRVGHFGFFRRGVGEGLWEETFDWLSGARPSAAAVPGRPAR
jgi:predicted alpha/beta hydrolase